MSAVSSVSCIGRYQAALTSRAAGGFGADFTQNSLLAKYRPDLLHLPTTNGEHCTGEGIKMGEVPSHPTIHRSTVFC